MKLASDLSSAVLAHLVGAGERPHGEVAELDVVFGARGVAAAKSHAG